MKKNFYSVTSFPRQIAVFTGPAVDLGEIKSEVIRKLLHFLIALTPFLAARNMPVTVFLLVFGMLGYTCMETLRLSGITVPLVSSITSMASRRRDLERFVLGPVTLGLGALFALLLFPPPVAAIGIYALAFGDGFASLAGKFFGRHRPAFLLGKSIEGSTACFTAALISAWAVSHNFRIALIAAITAAVVEALPLGDYDNLVLPPTVCLIVQFAILG